MGNEYRPLCSALSTFLIAWKFCVTAIDLPLSPPTNSESTYMANHMLTTR